MPPILPALGAAICVGVAFCGWLMVREPVPTSIFERGAEKTAARTRAPLVPRLFQALSERLAPRATGALGFEASEAIQAKLDAAGRPGGITVEGYAGRRVAYALLFAASGALLVIGGHPVVGIGLAAVGWFWLDLWLSHEARRRRARIDLDLPDFLDILAVTVKAGVGFRSALARVSEALSGPLGEEVAVALHQMELGATRRDAFTSLRKRTGSVPLSQFVTALLQAEELGVALSDALSGLADDMRRSTYQRARRQAARAAPRVSLIVALLIVPASVILIASAMFIGSGFGAGGLLGP